MKSIQQQQQHVIFSTVEKLYGYSLVTSIVRATSVLDLKHPARPSVETLGLAGCSGFPVDVRAFFTRYSHKRQGQQRIESHTYEYTSVLPGCSGFPVPVCARFFTRYSHKRQGQQRISSQTSIKSPLRVFNLHYECWKGQV
jgi:hypothetical protein